MEAIKKKLQPNDKNIININELVCIDKYQQFGYGQLLDRNKYLRMVRNLCSNSKSQQKQGALFVGFQLLAPRVINVIGGNRNLTFKIIDQQNKIIKEQKHKILVSLLGHGKVVAKNIAVDSTSRWCANINQQNGFQTLKVSIDCNVVSLLWEFTHSDITTIHAEITGNSFQDHVNSKHHEIATASN